MKKDISDMQWHILATAYVHLIFEVVRHDMTREKAHGSYAVCEEDHCTIRVSFSICAADSWLARGQP